MDIDWSKDDICFIANEMVDDTLDEKKLRKKIEPWLTAVFQSEHLSLLLGSGLTIAVCGLLPDDERKKIQGMQRLSFDKDFEFIKEYADASAKDLDRGKANIEDDIRISNEYLRGLQIKDEPKGTAEKLKVFLDEQLNSFAMGILKNEETVNNSSSKDKAFNVLRQFLISFSSRTATRDRLHIFTTNYDRFIEYALDEAGIYTIDRFVGKIRPIMRMHKLELDYHYNPPGIRGEPRYIEGVVRYTKIHGSIDWKQDGKYIVRDAIPFGASHTFENGHESLMIYPNSSKGIETVFFPYSELFRDFSTAICRPNSVLVTYGYGFGDSHINRIIKDMMTILSTHLVIISYDKADGRIEQFLKDCNKSQLTLLIGKKFADLPSLVSNYLPKAAIDRITDRENAIREKRSATEKAEISEKKDDVVEG